MKLRLLATIVSIPAFGLAQTQDAPPVDIRQLLEALKAIREQHDVTLKTRKQTAYQQVMAAAASGAAAAAFWKQAVKEVQFVGADHQAAKLSDWKDGDGDALNSKEGQNAARLHLYWLGLSLQHAMGTETKQMLQNIIDFTKQVRADDDIMAKLDNTIERAKDRKDKKDAVEELTIKRVHDQILRTAVSSSPVARWLQLGELLGDEGKKRGARAEQKADGKPDAPNGWEQTPGNVDGIFGQIILPEFRATKDPRLLEYWDVRLKQETERAAEKKLDVDQRDWTQVRRPGLLWTRAQDVMLLGQKNRAIGEMFNLVKTFPQHPNVHGWISAIEAAIAPPISTTPALPPVPATPGSVPAPVPVPTATTPPPTSTPAAPPIDPFRLNPARPPTQ